MAKFPLKVLSFDVGIKNLAYCLIHFKSNEKFKILEWDKINLIQDDADVLICCGKLKSGECCNKKATSSIEFDNKFYGFCKLHNKTEVITSDKVDEIFTKLDELNIPDGESLQCSHCDKKGNQCQKNALFIQRSTEYSIPMQDPLWNIS